MAKRAVEAPSTKSKVRRQYEARLRRGMPGKKEERAARNAQKKEQKSKHNTD